MINRIFRKITETKWRYKLKNSNVRVLKGANCSIASTANLLNCHIFVGNNAKLEIKDNVIIDNVGLFVYDGSLTIGADTILEKEKNSYIPEYIIDGGGECRIADHTLLRCSRLWCRFNGQLNIGAYTNINAFSEIRCDERIDIGSYCQISYNTRIWDTNTHNIYTKEKRRELTERFFPGFGAELERPKTAPVVIGNDCWLGERTTILKGSHIGDNVNIGYATIIAGKKVMDNATVVQSVNLSYITN